MISQTAGTRRAFRLAVCLLFWLGSPGLAWASLTGLSGLDASRLPDLPSKLETAALEQREQPTCAAFCAPVLRLELEASPIAGRVPDSWHPFGLGPRGERPAQALFATELGSWVVNYANDNPTRYTDPTGHFNVDISIDLTAAVEYRDRVLGASGALFSDFVPFAEPPQEWTPASGEGIEYGHKLGMQLGTIETFYGAQTIGSGFMDAGGGTASLVVPGWGEIVASKAYQMAALKVVAGAGLIGHGTWAMSKAQGHLKQLEASKGNSVRESRSATGAKPELEPPAGSNGVTNGPQPGEAPASGVYEVRGELQGKTKSYVGSGKDMDVRLGSSRHPARQLMDEGSDVTVTKRPVNTSDASSGREQGRILRTNEQVSLNEVKAEPGENLNKIRARAPEKFKRDLPKYGDRRQPPQVENVRPKATDDTGTQ